MSIAHGNSIDQQKERIMKNKKIVFLSTCAAVLSLTACGNKAESNVVETATPAPTATASPAPTATPIPENHDIDTAIDTYKNENAIEINPDDIGTDISDIDSLHDWLYNNGVTRESVQNDRDSGCKNPYLEGYLEYLDNLDKPSETPSNTGFGPGAHVKLEGATKTTYPGTDVEALEKDGVYYTVFSDGTTDGSYYVIDNEGNLSVELPWMGELQELSGEDKTQVAKDYLDSGDWKQYIGKYGN